MTQSYFNFGFRFLRLLAVIACLVQIGCTAANPVVTALTQVETKTLPQAHHLIFVSYDVWMHVYEVDLVSGLATLAKSFPFPDGIGSFKISPDATRLFVENGHGRLDHYSIGKLGGELTLTRVGSVTTPNLSAGTWLDICAIAEDNNSLQIREDAASTIHSYKIDPSTGALSYIEPVTGPVYSTGCVTNSKYTYAIGYQNDDVQQFTINADTKALTKINTLSLKNSGVRTGLSSAAMSEDRRFLFVAQQTAGAIIALELDSTTGAMTKVATSAACTAPNEVSVNATGKYLFVNCQNVGQVSVAFDPTTKQFSTPVTIATGTYGGFYVARKFELAFQFNNGQANLRKIYSNGTLGPITQQISAGGVQATEIAY